MKVGETTTKGRKKNPSSKERKSSEKEGVGWEWSEGGDNDGTSSSSNAGQPSSTTKKTERSFEAVCIFDLHQIRLNATSV